MIDPFDTSALDVPLNLQDWINIAHSVDMCVQAFSANDPDKPVPNNLDVTALKVRAEFSRLAKENPRELIAMMVDMLGAKGTEDPTSTPDSL